MSERWLPALALLAVGACGHFLLRKQSPFSLPVIALGITLLVGAFFPLASLYVRPRTWRNLDVLTEDVVLGAQVEYLLFALGFVLAVAVRWAVRRGDLEPPRPTTPPRAFVRFRDGLVAWGLVAGGGLLYALYVARVGLATLVSTEDFANKYLESRGLGVLLFGLNLVIAGVLWGEAGAVSRRSRRALQLVALAVFLWSFFFIAVRTYAVAIALGYLAAFCARRGVQVRAIRLRVFALLLVGYVGVEGYAILRSTWVSSGDFVRAVELVRAVDLDEGLGGVVGGSELSHPFLTTAEVLRYEEPGELHGGSYVDAVLAFAPVFLVPERPRTLAQDFVAEHYPALDARGGGASFSLVAEAWWNFGAGVGALLVGFALGATLVWCQARARRAPHGLLPRLLPYLAFVCLLLHRSQAQALFKQVVSLLLAVALLVASAHLVWSALRSPRPRPRGARLSPELS